MPSMHLCIVFKRFEGYRNGLDKKRQEVFDWLVFEVAGMREETLVNYRNHNSATVSISGYDAVSGILGTSRFLLMKM
jgi:hypothetical protein